MSSHKSLKEEFFDQEYREAYAEDFLNTKIAVQIYTIRNQRGMTQGELAEKTGTKQPAIARLEDVNYGSWNIKTLKKIANALGGWLNVSIEAFGTLVDEDERFSCEWLQRPLFEDDPAFKPEQADSIVPNVTSLADHVRARMALIDSASQIDEDGVIETPLVAISSEPSTTPFMLISGGQRSDSAIRDMQRGLYPRDIVPIDQIDQTGNRIDVSDEYAESKVALGA